jgi:2-(1,2-epoxy-1,2-dihydrophenyl)acetyl-CoA isomerase
MNNDYETIVFAENEGAYRLTLNRPKQLNSFNEQMKAETQDALSRVESGSPRVLLITGAGRGFCAGQDLGDRDVNAGPLDLSEAPESFYNPLVRTLTNLPAPVVCAVNGVAAGAGVNIAMACDIVLAKTSAKFVQSFSSIGLVPDAGGTWHLARRMGLARALGFTLLAERMSATEAAAAGLIWKAIDDDVFDAEVDRIMAQLATAPTFGLASAKKAIREGVTSSLDAALDLERDMQRACGLTEDYKEGVNAFKEKRTPKFRGS